MRQFSILSLKCKADKSFRVHFSYIFFLVSLPRPSVSLGFIVAADVVVVVYIVW